MSAYDREIVNPFTHARVLACRTTPTGSPELVEIARTEVVFEGGPRVTIDPPRSLRLSSFAEEGESGHRPATPKLIAQTLWTPGPSDLLVVQDCAVWDHFPAAFVRGIARITMSNVTQLLWPGAPSHDPAALMAWLGVVDKLNAVPGNDPELPLETEVRRTTFLLISAAFVAAEELTALLSAGLDVGTRRVVEPLFGDRAGDPALQAMVALSALPLPPVMSMPDPKDEVAWFRVGTDDLLWVANDPDAPAPQQQAAKTELERRRQRELDALYPRTLLKRSGGFIRL